MKKILLTLCLMVLASNSVWSFEIFCSPTGGGTGLTSSSPTTVGQVANLINGHTYTQPEEIVIYLLQGDYYDSLVLNGTNLNSNLLSLGLITSIKVYGSWHQFPPTFPQLRDFENDRTYFHAGLTGDCPIWIDLAPSTLGSPCIVDGIWIDTYDGNYYQSINDYAMRLVGGHYFISHCTVQDFHTTAPLLFLEGGNETFHIVNSVFAKDKAKHFLEAFCNLQIINSTIADIDLLDELIGRTIAHNMYRVDNTIIYNCLNYNNYYNEPFDIRNCIVETYNSSWMVDYGNNYWNTDPAFTGYPAAPYSCQASSVAMGNGAVANYTALSFMLNLLVVLYDADNHFRFDDYSLSRIDIGAYQTYSGGNYYYQNALAPNPMQAPQRQTEVIDEMADDDASGMVYNLLGQPVDDTYHGIVIRNGKKVLQ